MAWSAKTDATQLTSITTEQFFTFGASTNIPLNPGETADVYVKFVPAASPTDSLVISVYGSLDGGTTYDLVPVLTFMLDKGANPNSVSFLVAGYYSFRVGVKRSGTTDTIVSADCSYRRDGVSL